MRVHIASIAKIQIHCCSITLLKKKKKGEVGQKKFIILRQNLYNMTLGAIEVKGKEIFVQTFKIWFLLEL